MTTIGIATTCPMCAREFIPTCIPEPPLEERHPSFVCPCIYLV